VDAARPDRSTWLSANAGSGKTRVLTDRVARLLLEDVDPQHILCLTYTKAAASEMQNRLFDRLGGWAMLSNANLRTELEKLGVEQALDDDTLRKARRLFACAIETPGGLKIQTIHSFCSSLLRRFPLEAGVTPQFTEMDDRTARLLRAEVVEEIAAGPDAAVFYDLARHYTGAELDKLTGEITRTAAGFDAPLSDAELAKIFSVPADLTAESLLAEVFLGSEQALLDQLIPALEASSSNDQKAAAKLRDIAAFDLSALAVLEDVFLFKSGNKAFTAKIDSFPTKPCQEDLPTIMAQINDWMARVESAREPRLALAGMHKTRVLHTFARTFLKTYEATKLRRGLLDFDDLILRTRDLLTNEHVAAWVLYRLDGGIDHILVDEAQDTSPVQWQVIERLAQEFTSGEGARADVPRTIFVVGDKKQSIYSFQGADPREFDRMKDEFANRLKSTNTPLSVLGMEYSFRSSNAVLSLVDQTFANAEQSGFAPDQGHKSFKSDMPGRVDLWPVIEKPDKEDQPEWYLPVDTKAPNDPAILLARKIARTIRQMIDDNTPIPDGKGGMAPAQPGDFLILVQRRSALFHEIIRECKDQNLPIAGADRLKVGAEMAVRDLGALLSYLSTPEDSLALATALRSPLFGWSEAQLYDLAHGRAQKYLSAELRDRAADFPETTAILDDLRRQADYLRPYDLLQRILTRHDGRGKLLARLGVEAEDGIDALLSQAMAYEQRAVDSLTGFLVWLETDDLEIKRQMDSAGNRIRVMTVHGAKGLEAPIVILPDTGQRKNDIKDQILDHQGTKLWKTGADDAPQVIRDVIEGAKAAQNAERDRLLYVAMTRAEKWLIVAAAGDLGKSGDTWYDKVRAGLEACAAAPLPGEGEGAFRLEHGDWTATGTSDRCEETQGQTPALPAYFHSDAPNKATALETLKPSELGGKKALPGEGLADEEAKRRGRQIHRLLEILPAVAPDSWSDTAARILANGPDAAEGAELDALLSEAQGVLTKPELAHLFTPDVLAEVPISANIEALQNRRIHGIIDALIVTPETVLAVDFKTNTEVPDSAQACPDGLLRQMGAYAHALASIYPGRNIQTAFVWTRTADLMELPYDLVTKALKTTSIA
jgi:ATP-dependent helicase/nuclease subunit A